MLPQKLTNDVMTPVIIIIYVDVITGKMADKRTASTLLQLIRNAKKHLIIRIRPHKQLLCE